MAGGAAPGGRGNDFRNPQQARLCAMLKPAVTGAPEAMGTNRVQKPMCPKRHMRGRWAHPLTSTKPVSLRSTQTHKFMRRYGTLAPYRILLWYSGAQVLNTKNALVPL